MDPRGEAKRNNTVRRAVIALLICLLLIGAAASLRIKTVTVEGCTHYTAEQFERLLFPTPLDRNPLLFLFRENTGESMTLPFVDRYSVEMEGLTVVHIIVYEKQIVGYVEHQGRCIYFDRDGCAVESSSEETEHVPRVLGLSGGRIVMNEKLPVENESVFQVVLSVSQFLQSRSILWEEEEQPLVELIDTIHVDKYGYVTCILGDLQVYLGNSRNMEEKLLTMSDVLPHLEGLRGTVYLDNYNEAESSPSYVFRERQWKVIVTPQEAAAEAWETDPVPVTAAPVTEAVEAVPEESVVEVIPGSAAEGAGQEPAASQAVDGDGVDDIPEDYVGGDGYGR